ncbi:MAG TPA: sigma-70 family RNA polymerase sigma factor [Ilumatobacteraceae bacterium]|nr:sigma-70 family RNA polymerase sigma factor [Ilumatobacteraceae bacterium]
MSTPDLDLLVAAAIEGDNRAVAELVRSTEPTIRRLCRALGSIDNEDDLVQETYLRALRSLPSYRGESPFPAWLAAVARHVCADDVRRRQRQRRLIGRLQSSAAHREQSDATDHGGAVTHHLLDQLSPDRREAFALTQILGYSYDEAAQITGCPIGTIRSRVARARGDLFDLLDSDLLDEGTSPPNLATGAL